jgi:hypothetical protein
MKNLEALPIAVIGAGPVGLAAAAHLTMRNLSFVVLEASDGVSGSLRSTAHVRLFSPMKLNTDPVASRLLESHGWQAPEESWLPTAGELCALYLEPLAALFERSIRYGTRVEHISRRGFDKLKTAGRHEAPFVLRVRSQDREEEVEARAVLDASGTWSSQNWMGAHGLPALGEQEHAARMQYGMPDVLGRERPRYANKRVLVVGSGHSAIGNLLALAELADAADRTRLVWAVRGSSTSDSLGGGARDGLPARGSLGRQLKRLLDADKLELHTTFHIEAVSELAGALQVTATGLDGTARSIPGLDEIIVSTGSRPDLSLARELRVRMDPWLESTELLAPLIDPNEHSCGTVPPHGHRELNHPEPGYYALGAKSYGRAPNFLMATGYEQVRSVVAALAGDLAAADAVQLVLPETGVCKTAPAAPSVSGCSGAPATESSCAPDTTTKPTRACCG